MQCSFPRSTRKTNPQITLKFGEETIQLSETAKYLGVTIDDHLSFKQYFILLESKVARPVGVIAKLSYYLPLNVMVDLYYALVHTHLLYALSVWASTCKTYLSKLQRLQNKALRIITRTKIRKELPSGYFKTGRFIQF